MQRVSQGSTIDVVEPDPVDVAGFTAYLSRYQSALPIESAVAHLALLNG